MHYVAKSGSQATVELLLAKGVNPELTDEVRFCVAEVWKLVKSLVCVVLLHGVAHGHSRPSFLNC